MTDVAAIDRLRQRVNLSLLYQPLPVRVDVREHDLQDLVQVAVELESAGYRVQNITQDADLKSPDAEIQVSRQITGFWMISARD